MRLIDADAVLDELNKWEWQELYLPIHFKENIIDVLPSVTPTQKCVENALSALDCISRQAVIDLISKFILEIHSEGGRDLNAHTNDVLRQILRNVKSDRVLPPVNPQEPKTGHCKDCKYFEYDSVAKVDGVPLIVAHEICSRWGDGCKTKEDGYCFLFEPQESEDKKC